MRPTLALVLVAACHRGGALSTTAPVGNDTVEDTDEVFVDARTLLVDGPTPTTPRVQLARFGRAELKPGGEASDANELAEWFDTLAVAETRGRQVRVRYDEAGDARLLLWIDRTDLKTVIARDAAVAAGPAAAFPERGQPGAWLLAGTVPDELRPATADTRRELVVDVDDLKVVGEIDAATLGDLWIPPPEPPQGDGWVWLDEGTAVRAAPDAAAAVLATTTGTMEAIAGTAERGWVPVETPGPHVVVIGYVAEEAVVGVLGALSGSERGGQARAASKDSIEVPLGACLYDGKDGALAGVALATYRRDQTDLRGGWHEVLASSGWGAFSVAVHEIDGKVELCADSMQLNGY